MKQQILILICIASVITPAFLSYNVLLSKNESTTISQELYAQYSPKTVNTCYPLMENSILSPNFDEPPTPPQMITAEEEYSWTNYQNKDFTTPVKDQEGCGGCWVFAAIGVLESVIKIKEECPFFNPDLSEQYILSCLPLAGSCYGGWPYKALRLMLQDTNEGNNINGCVMEHCLSYRADDDLPCENKCSCWKQHCIPLKDCGYFVPDGTMDGRMLIKSQIMQTGPVTSSILVTEDFIRWGCTHHNKTDYFCSNESAGGINHIIIIVGWKDDETIANGGYWVCKNSWGADWGYQGFFNIEYGTLNIDNQYSIIAWVDYDKDSYNWEPIIQTNDHVYGYVDEPVRFSANTSFDPDNEPITYKWNFGNGIRKQGSYTSFCYNNQGTYTVNLTITDEKNHSVSKIISAHVQSSNRPPTKPKCNGLNIVYKNKMYTYKIQSTDPELNCITYKIYWGDNRQAEFFGPFSSGEEISINHSYSQNGFYVMKISALDGFGEESPLNYQTITVTNSKEMYCFLTRIYISLQRFPVFSD